MAAIDLVALHALTAEKISKTLFNSVPDHIPLVQAIKEGGNFKEIVDGGRQFSEPAIINDSQATGAYEGTDNLDVTQQGGIEKFQYTGANIYGSIFLAGEEEADNNGTAGVVDIYKARLEQMMSSKMNKWDSFLMGAKDDATTGQKAWLGLQDIISDTNTTTIPGTGVNRVTNTKAQNVVDTTSVASQTAFNTGQAGRDAWLNVYLQCAFGEKRPTWVITTRTIWAAYNLGLQTNERFNGNMSKANGGFPTVTFMADAKVVWSDNCLAGHSYFINPKFLKLKVLQAKNFKFRGMLPSYNQDVKSDICTTRGQLTTGGPRFNGVWTGGGF